MENCDYRGMTQEETEYQIMAEWIDREERGIPGYKVEYDPPPKFPQPPRPRYPGSLPEVALVAADNILGKIVLWVFVIAFLLAVFGVVAYLVTEGV